MRALFLALLSMSCLGKPVTYIHADRITHDPIHGTLSMTTLQLRYPYQNQAWHISAHHATISPSGRMHMSGHILLQQGDDRLRTQSLDVDPNHHLIFGTHTISGQLHDNQIKAPSFTLQYPHGTLTFPQGLSITHELPQETVEKIEHLTS